MAKQLGPGLVTGAADDDPSGIATYSQAGAQFGYGLLWTMVLLTLLEGLRAMRAGKQVIPGANLEQRREK